MYKDTKVSGASVPGKRFQDMFGGIVHSSATQPLVGSVYNCTLYIVHSTYLTLYYVVLKCITTDTPYNT
jgi:hypothetical protein